MSGIVDKLADLVESIKNLPQKIGEKFAELLKEIFVPDTEDLENQLNSFLQTIKMKFNFDTEFFESLFDGEQTVQDSNADYEIPGVGVFNLKFFDSKFFVQGVEYFRPFIRGFIVLMLALFNIRMAMSFIRQDAGFVTGKAVSVSTKEDK